jgi:predicted TIM-barrel fold metal-dependent hydrolase
MIFDGHAYCIPDLRGDGGFKKAEQLQRHLQQAIAVHHQPPIRISDGSPGDNGHLIDLSNWPSLDALREANFRTASNGRFEWTADGEGFFKQYFPPSITDMQYPPDKLVAEMDYAGVSKALLHRTPYLGIGNQFISECVAQYPERLMGLAHVEEWLVAREPERSIAKVEAAVKHGGLSGLQFLPPQLNLYNQRGNWDAPQFQPFWDGISELGIPVFFSLKEREEPRLESYLNELRTLLRWMERYLDVPVVLTHGIQWRLFMDGGGLSFPEEVWKPFESPNVYLQLMFPIALGAVWDYPMPQVRPTIEECVNRVGAHRLIWGTDMPIVMRFWSYRQNIDFITRYCGFLSDAEMDLIMGGTVAKLLGVDWPDDSA